METSVRQTLQRFHTNYEEPRVPTATEAFDQKDTASNTSQRSILSVDKTSASVVEQLRNIIITFEYIDRPIFKVSYVAAGHEHDTREWEQVVTERGKAYLENAMAECICLLTIHREPPFMIQASQSQEPFWHSVVTKGQDSSTLYILICREGAFLENQILRLHDSSFSVDRKGQSSLTYYFCHDITVSMDIPNLDTFFNDLMPDFPGLVKIDSMDSSCYAQFENDVRDSNSECSISMLWWSGPPYLIVKLPLQVMLALDETSPNTNFRGSDMSLFLLGVSELSLILPFIGHKKGIRELTNCQPSIKSHTHKTTLAKRRSLATLITLVFAKTLAMQSHCQYSNADKECIAQTSNEAQKKHLFEREHFSTQENCSDASHKSLSPTLIDPARRRKQIHGFRIEQHSVKCQTCWRTQHQVNRDQCKAVNDINTHITTNRFNDSTYNHDLYTDVSFTKVSSNPNSLRNGEEDNLHSRHVCDGISRNKRNRNNCNMIGQTSSGVKNVNSYDQYSDTDSSDSEIDCAYSDNDERHKVTWQIDENASDASPTYHHAGVETFKLGLEKHEQYSIATALDNSSNSTPEQAESASEFPGKVVCESFASPSDRTTGMAFLHPEARVCTSINRYIGQTLEKSAEANLRIDFSSANRQHLDSSSSSDRSQCDGTTELSTDLKLEILKERLLNAPVVEIINSEVDLTDDLDVLNQDTVEENHLLKANICSFSDVQKCNTDKRMHVVKSVEKNRSSLTVDERHTKLSTSVRDENDPTLHESNTAGNGIHASVLMRDASTSTTDFENIFSKTDLRIISTELDIQLGCLDVHVNKSVPTKASQCCSKDVGSAMFLEILTKKLEDYANKDNRVSNLSVLAATEGRKRNRHRDGINRSQTRAVKHTTNTGNVFSDFGAKYHKNSPRQQHNKQKPATTSSKRVGGRVNYAASKDKAVVISKSQSSRVTVEANEKQNFSEEVSCSSSTREGSQKRPWQNSATVCIEAVQLEIPLPDQEKTYADSSHQNKSIEKSTNFQDNFFCMSETKHDAPRGVSDKPPSLLSKPLQDASTKVTYDKGDISYKVDVFKTMEYASTVSHGHSIENSYQGTTSCEKSAYTEGRHSSVLTQSMPGQMSISSVDSYVVVTPHPGERRECLDVSRVAGTTKEKWVAQKDEENPDSYNRDRILRASQRRRQLMTEIEEITSCADAYNWPRYDSKNYGYEARSLCQDFDYEFSRQVAEFGSAFQGTDQHIIGTLTIEYLHPPVNGLVFLK